MSGLRSDIPTEQYIRITYLVRLAEVAHIHIGYCKITTCYRARPDKRANAVAFLVYIYVCRRTTYLVPHGAPVTRKRRTGRLRFNGQYNRLENGYFSSKPWLEIGSSYEAADLPTYL